MHISYIPPDVQALIFEDVIISDRSLSLRGVCKPWTKIIDEKVIGVFVRHFTNEIDQIPEDFKLQSTIQEIINSDSTNLVKFQKIDQQIKIILVLNSLVTNVEQIKKAYAEREYNLKILWNQICQEIPNPPQLTTCAEIHEWLQKAENSHNIGGLNLCEKNLTSLPPEIGLLTELQNTDIDGNTLTSLPPQIGLLTKLYRLNIAKNRLTSLPSDIDSLKELKFLHLSGNNLTSLPPQIGSLSKLKVLALGHNQLTSLPFEIAGLTQLEEIFLRANPFTSLSSIDSLTKLKYVYLDDNQFDKFHIEISLKLINTRIVLS